MAQSVGHLTLARVMISQFMYLSPTSGSLLLACQPEPASDPLSPSLCSSPTCTLLKKKKRNEYIFLKTLKNRMLFDGAMNEHMWYTHVVKYYIAIKKDELKLVDVKG